MDPDANIEEQRSTALEIVRTFDDVPVDGNLTIEMQAEVVDRAQRLAELVIALDEWLKAGGFLPAAWQR